MNDVFRILLVVELIIGTLVAVGLVTLLLVADGRPGHQRTPASLSTARRVSVTVCSAVALSVLAVSLGAGSPSFDSRLLVPFAGATACVLAGSLSVARSSGKLRASNRRRADLRARPFWEFAPVGVIKFLFVVSFGILLAGGLILAFVLLQPSSLNVLTDRGENSVGLVGVAPDTLIQAAVAFVGVATIWLGGVGCLRRIALAPMPSEGSEKEHEEVGRRYLSTVIVRVAGAGLLVLVGLFAQDLGADLIGSIGYEGAGVSVTVQTPTSGLGLALHAIGAVALAVGLGVGAAGLISTARRRERLPEPAAEASA